MQIAFGKYNLLRRLARGGMAELYLGRYSLGGVDRMAVLKVVANRYAEDHSFNAMFQDEVRIAATLNHPNIGQVFDVDEVEGRLYLAMEYLHGKDLRAVVRQSRRKFGTGVSPEFAVQAGVKVCSALQYAHDLRDLDGRPMNIIHRDVSPSNIMITFDGQVKLIDFGIARAANRSSLTRPGCIKGKVRYLSPEQLVGGKLDRRTDVFTLGISLWEATMGRHLFDDKQDIQVYEAINKGKITRPTEIVPSFPRDLEKIILRALSHDANDRYPDARAFQQDLEDYARRHAITLSDIEVSNYLDALFDRESQSWAEAQEAGRSLLDYVLEQTSSDAHRIHQLISTEDERWTHLDPSAQQKQSDKDTIAAASLDDDPTNAAKPAAQAPASAKKTVMFGSMSAANSPFVPSPSTPKNLPLGATIMGTGQYEAVSVGTEPEDVGQKPKATAGGAITLGRAPRNKRPSTGFPLQVMTEAGGRKPGGVLKVAAGQPVAFSTDGQAQIIRAEPFESAMDRSPTVTPGDEAASNGQAPVSDARRVTKIEDGAESQVGSDKSSVGDGREPRLTKDSQRQLDDQYEDDLATAHYQPRRRRPKTGDWSHRRSPSETSRPGTHPYFRDDVSEHLAAAEPDSGTLVYDMPRAKAPMIIAGVVLALGLAALVALWVLRAREATQLNEAAVAAQIEPMEPATTSAAAAADAIVLTSRPSGARVYSSADGAELGKTPLRIDVESLVGKTLELHLPGYLVASVELTEDVGRIHVPMSPRLQNPPPLRPKGVASGRRRTRPGKKRTVKRQRELLDPF